MFARMSATGTASDRRLRPAMEDRVTIGDVGGALVVAVFDGHGGAAVAEHAARHTLEAVGTALASALRGEVFWRRVFERIDLAAPACGSTATLLLLRDGVLSLAWVGDSRVLLVTDRGCRVLTADHRIGRESERRRVEAAGAVIVPPYVVDPGTGNGLMVTRALGDRELRRVGILPEPETASRHLEPGDMALIAATDGLWDVAGDEEVATVCREAAPQVAASRLVALVGERGGADNVSVALVGLETDR